MTGEKASPGSSGVHESNGHEKDGLPDLPLYGSEKLANWPAELPVVIVEREEAADALNETESILALGTGTGARGTPSAQVLEDLRDREVILWPYKDKSGHAHMRRVGEGLEGVADSVAFYDCPEAPEKTDAADHPAVIGRGKKALGSLLDDLLGAPRWEPEKAEEPSNGLLRGRVLLGKGMVDGIEPPEELEPGVLLKGKVHQVYSGPGSGKTMYALYLTARCIERGQKVLFFDTENGLRIVSERLALLGVDPGSVDEYLIYFPAPNLPLTAEAKAAYEELLDEVRPDLIVFDSWINFLASAGLSENESVDIARWSVAFAHPARNRRIAVLLLDHVPHDNSHARGSTRKKDEVDVQWKLHLTKPFDRDSVGEIVLHREKDREGWLPPSVRYSVGGGRDGFVFSRSAGTIEENAEGVLTERQKQALDALKAFGQKGAGYAEWQRSSGLKGTTFDRAISALSGRGLVTKADGRYFARTGPLPPRGAGVENCLFTANTDNPHEPPLDPHTSNGGSGEYYPRYPHTLKGGGNGGNSGGGYDNGLTPEEVAAEFVRHGSGSGKNLAVYLRGDTTLEILARSVLTGLGREPTDWSPYATLVDEAARDGRNHPTGCACDLCDVGVV